VKNLDRRGEKTQEELKVVENNKHNNNNDNNNNIPIYISPSAEFQRRKKLASS